MRKLISFLAIALLATGASAQQDTLKYRISLKDKAATEYSLKKPEKYLSAKAIERRRKQNLPIDSTDLPVCRKYIDEIRKQGVKIVVTGKWDNFVTVSCNDTTLIDRIAALPFVLSTEKVWISPGAGKPSMAMERDSVLNQPTIHPDSIYGRAITQIQMSNGDKLHEAGFKGQGMTIAVIDAGFHNVDKITAMQNIRILGTKDFVNQQADIFAESSHGMSVLSCIGMNRPDIMTGTAPEASFWLLRSEDEYSEHLVEQDYWSAAVEFADSVGVDVINTSLGYYTFDDKSKNYKYRDLDGRHALMSRQASHIADKGMILVCSAGNSGAGSWKKITPPGDADNVLTVGAIDKRAVLATFSSVGNTADHRVKPDVVAVGVGSDVIRTDGNQGRANGTSFSSPIMCGMVTCLWQACPTLTAKEVIELVRRSGDRAGFPDNIYGYGVPDMWKAYNDYKSNNK
ncbi:S8 family serine peptidase [Bacteroides cellulosilyticus]|uniref:S8 family peptidase n=1 Tax=Bacteroides cellulosilyticus TaxID=246787 RepID=UPI00234D7BAC|nr:S8 family serine peptidase [Bacteroides cellulosilyticus]MDC7177376.1 S8 family serine peptidase [Bacteroides cellulosilyticus]MDC7179880.1 S8 family serine peptidase [Bacteroides cellulosilyticus]